MTGTHTDADMAATELAFFRGALTAFVQSAARFQVVCTAVDGRRRPALATSAAAAAGTPPSLQRLVVLDASFNPPSVAHMQMATSGVRAAGDPAQCRLLLLLSVNNADKAPKPAAFAQRLAMMLAAARDMQRAAAEDAVAVPVDIGLTSQPYFPDKSSAIAASALYGAPEQIFLVGYDTLVRIFDPKYYGPTSEGLRAALTPFLRRARLRVTTRPDDQWGSEAAQRAWLPRLAQLGGGEPWEARVDLADGPYQGGQVVSSTMARAAAKAQDWTRLGALVSPSVRAWIEGEGLYREDKTGGE